MKLACENKRKYMCLKGNSAWGSTAQVYFLTDFLLSFKIVLTRFDSHEPARSRLLNFVFRLIFGYVSRFVNVFLTLETFFNTY